MGGKAKVVPKSSSLAVLASAKDDLQRKLDCIGRPKATWPLYYKFLGGSMSQIDWFPNDPWIKEAIKPSLRSEDNLIVGRVDEIFLRILGKDPSWEIMTATAGDDKSDYRLASDRIAVIAAACRTSQEFDVNPSQHFDVKKREYIKICTFDMLPDEPSWELRRQLTGVIDVFFAFYDEYQESRATPSSELANIYRQISDDGEGDDIYLSDGVWLTETGVAYERGR